MSEINRRGLLAGTAAIAGLGALPTRSARAQAANTIRIGVLNDQSGPYRDISGPYGVQCTLQAVAEFGARGFNVEVINADHQNRPDVGVNIARQWYDQGVDMILDVPTSSVGPRRERRRAREEQGLHQHRLRHLGPHGRAVLPNTIHWMYDTYMLAKSTGAAMVRAGGDSWFFITADYAFGHALERDTGNFVRSAGGRVLGSVRYPFPPPATSPPSWCRRRPRAPR
jgi:branched-chain amino acid transport system substrate-binding protein